MHVADVLVSLSGVVLIVGLVWWAMGNALAGITDERAARERIAAEHPDFTVGRLGIGADGRSALAISADDREAVLLFTLGNKIVCWRLPRTRLQAKLLHPAGVKATLVVDTGDFTRPSFRMLLADEGVARALCSELQGPPVEGTIS
jgi:hypothetical protein